jgi:hypothetical protein
MYVGGERRHCQPVAKVVLGDPTFGSGPTCAKLVRRGLIESGGAFEIEKA